VRDITGSANLDIEPSERRGLSAVSLFVKTICVHWLNDIRDVAHLRSIMRYVPLFRVTSPFFGCTRLGKVHSPAVGGQTAGAVSRHNCLERSRDDRGARDDNNDGRILFNQALSQSGTEDRPGANETGPGRREGRAGSVRPATSRRSGAIRRRRRARSPGPREARAAGGPRRAGRVHDRRD